MFNQQSRLRDVVFRGPWVGYAMLAAIASFVPLAAGYTEDCYVQNCREALAPLSFSVWVAVVGVGITLAAAAAMIYRAGRRDRPRFKWAVFALVGVVVSSCGGGTLPTSSLFWESRDIKAALGLLPGVERASTKTGENFSAVVTLTQEATAEQTTAIIAAFRDRTTATPDLRRWRTDIEIRRSQGKSSFKVGRDGYDRAADHAAQWHALSRALPEDDMTWTYRWSTFCCDTLGPGDLITKGHAGAGDISVRLASAKDATAVSETYRRLIREFPDLGDAEWTIETSASGGGSLTMNRRYPTELELSVWHRLSADQTPPHTVLMASVYRGVPHQTQLQITEQLRSSNLDDMKLLAEKHLPVIAELAPSDVEYLATTDPFDSLNTGGGRPLYNGRTPPYDRSVYITIGRCGLYDHTQNPVERALAARYEHC